MTHTATGFTRKAHTKNQVDTLPQCQLPTPVPDPPLPFRQSSFAEEFDCELSNSTHSAEGLSATVLLSLRLRDRLVVLQGTATSPRKGEHKHLHALKNLALGP